MFAGMEEQKTLLGTCDGCNVVVMKDFIGEDEIFVPFNDVGESTLEQDRRLYQYSYDDIMRMLSDNVKLTHLQRDNGRSFLGNVYCGCMDWEF